MILSKAVWLPALLAFGAAAKKADGPTIEKKKFDEQPRGLFFFDDTETAIVTEVDAGRVWRTTDAGLKWNRIDVLKENQVYAVYHHPYNNKVAVALGRERRHWYTQDQGESWRKFDTDADPAMHSPIGWHADKPEHVLFHGADRCDLWGNCVGKTWYTNNGFEHFKPLIDSRKTCLWARNTDVFTTGKKETDDNRILCVTEGKFSNQRKDYRLVITDNFGEDVVEPPMSDGRTVAGMAHLASAKGFIVAAARSEGSDEMALYVTDDTFTWHRAEFGQHKLQENAYTILESTNYSIQVDLMSSSWTNMGNMFTSNSNGTYFTRNIAHTNRDDMGYVDFEKVTNIQGIILVNTVKNWETIEQNPLFENKQLISQVSFDDARTFHNLKTKSGDDLHLHSYTEQRNSGKVFSSAAPGMVMGVGNTGAYLKSYEEGDVWVSDDAGATWTKALSEAHKYEFGDKGSLLVAVYDEGETSEIKYSINHGKDWKKADLGDKVIAHELTTIPDSTGIKFVLVARKGTIRSPEWWVYTLDFAGLHERKCKDDDFEMWHAREVDGKPGCIMGRTQSFRRRKPNADCFILDEFVDPEPKWDTCKCTEEDYECDFNFVRTPDRKECKPVGPIPVPDGQCKNGETFKGSSGWRLIPGNQCEKKGGVAKDEPVERPCEDSKRPVASGKVESTFTRFKDASDFAEYYYLERTEKSSSEEQDETIVVRDDSRTAHISHDHGKTWAPVVKDKIIQIYPHQYFNDIVYFLTEEEKVYYSYNRGLGNSIHSFKAPLPPVLRGIPTLGFHPHEKSWIIWTGKKDCQGSSTDCHYVAYKSTKGGVEGSWEPMLPFVQKCQFVWREEREKSEELVYCEQYAGEDTSGTVQLLSSTDWFETKKVHYDDVANFATMAEFIIVAKKTEDHKWLKVDVSIDGQTFAETQFPHKFQMEHRQAYTVLDSSTHAVFLHVTINPERDQEYGTILKSNSNGTDYVLSIAKVNRNEDGYVDFEKMQGLEGVAMVNIVANTDEVDKGAAKKLKSMITHNDGADWTLISAPEKDSDGKKYSCSGSGLEKCSLHIHGYTERADPRDTFSSPSAVGLMMGVGNVGEFLGRKSDGNTYVTRDGGITWHEAFKGTYMWEYGDQGSIIVIVKDSEPVKSIFYSKDEGSTWEEYEFTPKPVIITQISTVPSDTSKNFLLWGRAEGKLITVNLDFSGLYDRACNLDEEHPTDGDYDLWEPKHPMQENNCLFGHVAQYHRKKIGAECWNEHDIQQLHSISKNCSCTTQDFECDYNFERASDGSCKLVEGLEPIADDAVCKDPNVIEYKEVTGYRRIPITTCSGGKELDLTAGTKPCPNKEEEYNRKHGASGVAIFFAVVLPFAAAAGIGYYVWRNWDGKFGRIRLGDSAPSFDSDSKWISWPVAAVSGLVAVIAAVPLLVGSLWRSVSSRFGGGGGYYGGTRYTTRGSFARGDYAVVDPDEGELLGEDSDEEV